MIKCLKNRLGNYENNTYLPKDKLCSCRNKR